MFGFSTDAKAVQKSASVDFVVMNSANADIYAFLQFMMLSVKQTFRINRTNGPLGSSMNTTLVDYVFGALAKNA